MKSFLTELRRRNVFKVGAAYLVLGWLIVQITETIAPALALPGWTLPLVIWLIVIGFPLALLFAWAFELTPDGVKRSTDVLPTESITPKTGTRLNALIIVLMAAGLALLLIDRFWLQGEVGNNSRTAASSVGVDTVVSYDSIAVLPFANLSDDSANEHFGDGLAEELLNILAGVEGLKVAARTSSFYFKDKSPTIKEVADALDVETIVEGSVQRSGNTIRVVAQLISADTGAHLWSDKYDRPLDDLFDVQDDIAAQIVSALMPHLGGADQPVFENPSDDITPEQFERFLLARHKFYDNTDASVLEARDGFLSITNSAPTYAPAWAWLARSWVNLAASLTEEATIAYSAAAQAIDMALSLNPREPMAYVAKGLLMEAKEDHSAAVENFERALALDPNLVDAYTGLEDSLAILGKTDAAIEALQKARRIDPLHPDVLSSLAHLLNLQGHRDEAFAVLDKLAVVNETAALNMEAHLYADNGDYAHALYVFETSTSDRADTIGFFTMLLGLHDELSQHASVFQPIGLAMIGNRDEALAALDAVRGEIGNSHRSADIGFQTLVALGDFQKAHDLLRDRWSSLGSESPGPDLDFWDYVALVALKKKLDQTEDIDELIAEIRREAGDSSPLHNGGYRLVNGYYNLLSDNMDLAVEHFEALATVGEPGLWIYGTPLPYPWLFDSDPRFASVFESLAENRQGQLMVLERLRDAGLTRAEARADYLSESVQ